MKLSLVIIGNGMAPGRMLDYLLEASAESDSSAFDITIFNDEPRVNYNRLMLSPVLAGEKSYEDIITHDDAWYQQHQITLYKADRVVAIDTDGQIVTSRSGIKKRYDRLVIATGSLPNRLPVPGNDLDGVLVYRDLDDVQAMLDTASAFRQRKLTDAQCSGGNVVVIGGGLLGLEAAAGLAIQGMNVTVLQYTDTLMNQQLDPAAGALLEAAVIAKGIRVITRADTQAIITNDGASVAGVELKDGTVLDADIVVMAVGIRPSVQLAESAGIAVNRGIVVNDAMETSIPSIYALGECVEHREICYGLVAPLYDMARTLAMQLLEQPSSYTGSVTSAKLKVSGIDLYSAGDFAEGPGREEIVLRDARAGVYKRLVIQNDCIVGIVLYGDTSDGPWFFDFLKKGKDISALRDTLIFGQSLQPTEGGGREVDPTAAVAALPDDAEICGCNGVCKSAITNSINTLKLTTLDEVRAHTKASSSCGTCSGLVEQLMMLSLGDQYQPAAVTPMCPCTNLGHAEVRRLIKSKKLNTVFQVMQELEWASSCGCAKCRPAINYYLVAEWPEDYRDDYQSRFINERAHANIQKDGTYSVVPRMWGGMTSSAELRAIADVCDKFEIPAVKVTGGQRIDMLGIKKDDLPLVWKDLGDAGFVSGHAYAKGLRTVKTCVGKTWCRFGTQDSTGLGIRLEKFLWGSWTPAKVKLAVSGCPRNCAEATCKDMGVICVDSGYELHFAGAAGLDIQGTQVLGSVTTEDAVVEHLAALMQMYREQGHYLERMYKWAKRIGVSEIRQQIIEDSDRRLHYFDRFVASQQVAQVDPWAERVQGKHHQEFSMVQINEPQRASA